MVNPDGVQEHLEICKIYHNRDKNAVQNMISIIEELQKTWKRLLRFTRTESLGSFELCSTKDTVFTREVVDAT